MKTVCQALREIQRGNLKIQDFSKVPGSQSEPFPTSAFRIADLRWHLLDCTNCAQSMDEARKQLHSFDVERLELFSQMIRSLEGLLDIHLGVERSQAEGEAEAIIQTLGGDEEKLLWDGIDLESEYEHVFEKKIQPVYLWAIMINASLGEFLFSWLETFLHPAEPRALLMQDEIVCDYTIAHRDTRKLLPLAPEFIGIMSSEAESAPPLLRALFLAEAFSGLAPRSISYQFLAGECISSFEEAKSLAISWKKVWEHYSALAEMEVRGVTTALERRPYSHVTNGVLLQSISQQFKDLEEKILYPITVLMDLQTKTGKLQEQLLQAYQKMPETERVFCETSLRKTFGTHFDGFQEDTRRDLITAEYLYKTIPPELDFAPIILGYMRAFERELKYATKPFHNQLIDIAVRGGINSVRIPLDWTLGDFLAVFRVKNGSEVEPLFRERGMDFQKILEATNKANKQKRAKHIDPKDSKDATEFRTLFLGGESILTLLYQRKSKDSAGT